MRNGNINIAAERAQHGLDICDRECHWDESPARQLKEQVYTNGLLSNGFVRLYENNYSEIYLFNCCLAVICWNLTVHDW